MATDVYSRLAKFMDRLPAGFPPTESRVELRILRRLFTPEEAELAMHLALIPEEARVVARRAGIPVEEAAQRLEEMEKKGLVLTSRPEGKPPQYMATHWAIGIYEFQINKLTPELVRDWEEYFPQWWDSDTWQKAPQMRTIPVGESLSPQLEVMAYEQAEALVRSQKTLAVAPCICRQEQGVFGHACVKPLETCMTFGGAAEFILHNGMGRAITQDEALAILKADEAAGLVLQPANSRDAAFICACCGCCCGILRGLKMHPKPASIASSPFHARLDLEQCKGCGTCTERCQMEAVRLDDGHAVLDLDRCIGCGLCVSTCPNDAMSLVRKPATDQPYVPKDLTETNIKLGQARGVLATPELIGMMVRSKVDRLLAPR